MIIPEEIKNIVYKCLDSRNRISYERYRLYKTNEMEDFLKNNDITITDLQHIINDNLEELPRCVVCNNVIHNYWKSRTRKYCSLKCAKKDTNVQEKTKKTNLEKYGVENISQLETIKQQKIETCRKNFGCDFPQQSEKVKQLGKKTLMEKYGVHTSSIIPEVKEKIKQTNIEKYGVPFSQQSEKVKDKIKQTNIEKYGYGCCLQNPEIRKKQKETIIKKYGVPFPSQSKEIMNKIKSSLRKNTYESFMKYLDSKHLIMLSSKEDYIDSSEKELTFKCSICGQEFKTCNNTVKTIYCPNCKRTLYSIEEKNILDFIKNFYSGEIIENDRKVIHPYELDIYIPEKNLAIEFNGDYWHSTSVKTDKEIHQKKTFLSKEKGIRLIHIFEYEWRTKQPICESIIKSALGIYDKTIFARKCVVKEISYNDYKHFLEENHLQGFVNSEIRYGLFYQDELVSVIGFGKSRFKKNELELHRFCSKLNYKVIGGFSKLIKHSNIKDFVSYIDLSHFDGSGYFKCGFKEISITRPSYKWVNEDQILNRISTQKHKLAKLLSNFDSNLTEAENMLQNNYYQIYDCGNLKVQYKNCEEK